MDFEEPAAPAPFTPRDDHPWDDAEPKKAVIPRLPDAVPLPKGDEKRRGISNRDRSAVNMRLDGASYLEIADMLEFSDAHAAKRSVERALAASHGPEEWDSLRMLASGRAEQLFKRSSAMAAADFLVDTDTGDKIANQEKLRWHQQASMDLMNWATITGAKAATKVEITPGEERMDQIVSQLLQRAGYEEILDAEVLELEQIPDEPDLDE